MKKNFLDAIASEKEISVNREKSLWAGLKKTIGIEVTTEGFSGSLTQFSASEMTVRWKSWGAFGERVVNVMPSKPVRHVRKKKNVPARNDIRSLCSRRDAAALGQC